MNTPEPIIRPEAVAAKLCAHKNYRAPQFSAAVAKEPRLIELLHFLQWQSLQPGGLVKFVENLLARFNHSIGTAAMRRIAKASQPYTQSERREIIASFQGPGHDEAPEDGILRELRDQMCGHCDLDGGETPPDPAFVNKQNHPYFLDACKRIAAAALPRLLIQFCSELDTLPPDPWWFHDMPGALISMLDAQAADASTEIVMTEVSLQVFDALQFARAETAMVEIIGDSRFGKTESAKAFCAMHPGRARLVKTPCDNRDRSFLDALADSVGIETGPKITPPVLRAKIEYVLKHSGLMFIFDEAHWLMPVAYGPRTVPMRLNYVRSQVLENGCPVALVTTPQFHGPHAQKFERTTGFNMAQWRGRIMRTVQLPAELPDEDLSAVARHHFPELSQPGILRVVACALLCESYLFAVLKIAKNARAVARQKGRDTIQLDDLDAGIALAGISIAALTGGAPPAPAPRKQPVAVKRSRPVTPQTAAPPALAMTARATTPAVETVNT